MTWTTRQLARAGDFVRDDGWGLVPPAPSGTLAIASELNAIPYAEDFEFTRVTASDDYRIIGIRADLREPLDPDWLIDPDMWLEVFVADRYMALSTITFALAAAGGNVTNGLRLLASDSMIPPLGKVCRVPLVGMARFGNSADRVRQIAVTLNFATGSSSREAYIGGVRIRRITGAERNRYTGHGVTLSLSETFKPLTDVSALVRRVTIQNPAGSGVTVGVNNGVIAGWSIPVVPAFRIAAGESHTFSVTHTRQLSVGIVGGGTMALLGWTWEA